eukprot:s1179_g11.t1
MWSKASCSGVCRPCDRNISSNKASIRQPFSTTPSCASCLDTDSRKAHVASALHSSHCIDPTMYSFRVTSIPLRCGFCTAPIPKSCEETCVMTRRAAPDSDGTKATARTGPKLAFRFGVDRGKAAESTAGLKHPSPEKSSHASKALPPGAPARKRRSLKDDEQLRNRRSFTVEELAALAALAGTGLQATKAAAADGLGIAAALASALTPSRKLGLAEKVLLKAMLEPAEAEENFSPGPELQKALGLLVASRSAAPLLARSADAAWEEGLEAAGMDARQRCPGSRPGEFILNPYENAGQLMGNMIGLGISTLTLGAMTVFLFASRFRPSSQPQDLPAWMYFIFVVLLFLSCLLQAIAHAAIPAGENVTLLMVGRVLAALAMGCLLVIGTGLGEAHFSCRCWVAVWILSVGFATGFVVVVALSSMGGSELGEVSQAAVSSCAYVWMASFWCLAFRKGGTDQSCVLYAKLVAGFVFQGSFWLRALLDPVCGPRGHVECYAACGLGASVHYFLFAPLFLFSTMALIGAQDKDSPAPHECTSRIARLGWDKLLHKEDSDMSQASGRSRKGPAAAAVAGSDRRDRATAASRGAPGQPQAAAASAWDNADPRPCSCDTSSGCRSPHLGIEAHGGPGGMATTICPSSAADARAIPTVGWHLSWLSHEPAAAVCARHPLGHGCQGRAGGDPESAGLRAQRRSDIAPAAARCSSWPADGHWANARSPGTGHARYAGATSLRWAVRQRCTLSARGCSSSKRKRQLDWAQLSAAADFERRAAALKSRALTGEGCWPELFCSAGLSTTLFVPGLLLPGELRALEAEKEKARLAEERSARRAANASREAAEAEEEVRPATVFLPARFATFRHFRHEFGSPKHVPVLQEKRKEGAMPGNTRNCELPTHAAQLVLRGRHPLVATALRLARGCAAAMAAATSGKKTFKVGLCQMTARNDKEANFRTCKQLVTEAASQGCQLVALPECFAFIGAKAGEAQEAAEPLSGPTMGRYAALAKEQQVWLSLGGFQEKVEGEPDNKILNTHVILNSEGEMVSVYRKIHLFDAPFTGLVESKQTVPGADVVACDSAVGKLGVTVCYDVRFPQLYQQLRFEHGADPNGPDVVTREFKHGYSKLRDLGQKKIQLKAKLDKAKEQVQRTEEHAAEMECDLESLQKELDTATEDMERVSSKYAEQGDAAKLQDQAQQLANQLVQAECEARADRIHAMLEGKVSPEDLRKMLQVLGSSEDEAQQKRRRKEDDEPMEAQQPQG